MLNNPDLAPATAARLDQSTGTRAVAGCPARPPSDGNSRDASAAATYRLQPAALMVADLPTVVSNATGWLVGILAVLATFFLTLGGVRYMTAGGDPSEVERAKSALRSAGVGYSLALLAPVLLTVLKQILGV